MKFRSNRCKTKLFRSNNETLSVRGELPGKLFEEGVVFFDAGAKNGELIKREFFTGEFIVEIRQHLFESVYAYGTQTQVFASLIATLHASETSMNALCGANSSAIYSGSSIVLDGIVVSTDFQQL